MSFLETAGGQLTDDFNISHGSTVSLESTLDAAESEKPVTYKNRAEYVQSLRAKDHITPEESLAKLRAKDWNPNIGMFHDPTLER